MQRLGIIIAAAASIALTAPPATAQTLNLATAGDQNMVDYARDYLAPIFEKDHPGVRVKAVGTGPADAGSQKIMEKLRVRSLAEAVSIANQLGFVEGSSTEPK